MKIIEGFTLRTVMGEPVIVAEGTKQINFNKLISLNASAAFLWQSVVGKEFTVEDLANNLMAEYDIDRATALADSAEVAAAWIANGLVTQ